MKHPVGVLAISLVSALILTAFLCVASRIEVLNQVSFFIEGSSIGFGTNSYLVKDKSYESGAGSLSASAITSLDICWVRGNVTVELTDSDEISFSESCSESLNDNQIMRWKNENGTLKIRFGTFGGFFRYDPAKQLILKIPAAAVWHPEKISISTVSAGTTLDRLEADRFSYKTVSGNLTAGEVISQEIKLDSTSGVIRVSGASCQTLNANTVSGDVFLGTVKADRADLDTTSGNIQIGDGEIVNRLKATTTSGDMTFFGSAYEVEWDTTSGDVVMEFTAAGRRIETDGVSGDVTIWLPADISGFVVEFDSVSGDLESAFSGSMSKDRISYGDGTLEIESDSTSGDLTIRKR